MFRIDIDEDKLKLFEENKYVPAAISSLFLQFKNRKDEIFDNLHLLDQNKIIFDNDNRMFSSHVIENFGMT